jgi:hypothetical protein
VPSPPLQIGHQRKREGYLPRPEHNGRAGRFCQLSERAFLSVELVAICSPVTLQRALLPPRKASFQLRGIDLPARK